MKTKQELLKDYKLTALEAVISNVIDVSTSAVLVNSKEEAEELYNKMDSEEIFSHTFDVYNMLLSNGDIIRITMLLFVNKNFKEGYLILNDISSFIKTNIKVTKPYTATVNMATFEDEVRGHVYDDMYDIILESLKAEEIEEFQIEETAFQDLQDISNFCKFKKPLMKKYELLIDASIALAGELSDNDIPLSDRIFRYKDLYVACDGCGAIIYGNNLWYSISDNIVNMYIEGNTENFDNINNLWSIMFVETEV